MEIEKSMLLITSAWGNAKTFKLIPVTKECPFNEAIYDPDVRVLAIISKEKKESFKRLDKLDDNGDSIPLKNPKPGKPYKEERKVLETFYEYYIKDTEEIKQFIDSFALNSDHFNTDEYLIKQAA
ncbi:MAG TPA: hypothetical protein VGM30_10450 [Puia sp.]|jgi:hypothetical protein